eukprot:SM000027S09573  [mRNA]  locus=s27:104842:107137:+ [translate_table: standard]
MIKRRDYRLLHGSGGGGGEGSASGSSSSSSDSSSGAGAGGGDEPWPGEHAADCAGATVLLRRGSRLRPSSEHESDVESPDADHASARTVEPRSDEGGRRGARARRGRSVRRQWAEAVLEDDDEGSDVCGSDSELEAHMEEGGLVLCVGLAGRVLKCRICPQAVCLSEKSMEAHLASKGHARSLKKSREGRLAVMLNSEGEEEEATETHTERLQRLSQAAAPIQVRSDRKSRGRQRQRKRAKLKVTAAKEGTTSAEATPTVQSTPPRKDAASARPSATRAAVMAGTVASVMLPVKPATKKQGRKLRKRTE